MRKLADAGASKPQIASALGELFRDENSAEVKTDILNELGNLEDPSTYDQIVAGLGQHQPDEVHTAAIEELDSLGDERAIPLIQPFLTDRDEDVRNAPIAVLVNVQVMFWALPFPPPALLDCGIETLWMVELPLGSATPRPSTKAMAVV